MNIEKIKKLRRELRIEEEKVINVIFEEIEKTEEMDGVKNISKNAMIVSSKSLLNAPWSPSYFSKESQVKNVMDKLKGKNLKQIQDEISNIIKNKSIKNSSKKIIINPNMLKTLNKIKDTIDTINEDSG